MSEYADHAPETTVNCHVVQVRADVPQGEQRGECPTLSQAVLGEVTSALRKHQDPTRLANELWSIRKRHDLAGVAIVYLTRSTKILEWARPLDVTFGPVRLSEAEPALAALQEFALGRKGDHSEFRAPSTHGRLLLRVGIPAGTAIIVTAYTMLDLGLLNGLLASVLLAPFAALVPLTILGVYRWRGGQWFLVPGGVLVRRWAIGPLGMRTQWCTPRNSVLIIDQRRIGWEVRICRGYWPMTRSLTDVEVSALLASWQSLLRPASLEEIAPEENGNGST